MYGNALLAGELSYGKGSGGHSRFSRECSEFNLNLKKKKKNSTDGRVSLLSFCWGSRFIHFKRLICEDCTSTDELLFSQIVCVNEHFLIVYYVILHASVMVRMFSIFRLISCFLYNFWHPQFSACHTFSQEIQLALDIHGFTFSWCNSVFRYGTWQDQLPSAATGFLQVWWLSHVVTGQYDQNGIISTSH